MNNDHRTSLLTFVSELSKHYGNAPPHPNTVMAALHIIVDKYFNSHAGSFWIFSNSNVFVFQDMDGSQYMLESTGELLEDDFILQFCKEDFTKINQRMLTPEFTEEEQHFLLPYADSAGIPHDILWATLMWCGSSYATDWRCSCNTIYAEALYHGCLVEYKGRILASDAIEYIGCTGGDCIYCGETVPCLHIDNKDEPSCEYCSNLVTNGCPHAPTCLLFSCTHNPEKTWPVSAAGRRFYGRSRTIV